MIKSEIASVQARREQRVRSRLPDFPRPRDLAEDLCGYMKLAGVKRAELFISDETRLNPFPSGPSGLVLDFARA